ncbi:bacillithiol system redox-active protein YtxJ [Halalkalibacterium halodurans]|jgi:bacillithiol system protein YtxJ|uniref:General stress protein n=1 Tax=Halalkalibacterium halodurans TaxID=86665 RepID=A0A0M0KHD8_ALKHA|nr:bacillithiol system redox-active protein YtxJ [Halalkalibacterium halodurans]MDY7223558.1 bacillithiol system redox-active protein YtxJ [Halalkalibacterium halodurans]MDY7242779.1 bacillithiol system redox-active protein YtxJ [Halalkalibacterium halodurans]MED3646578.1 bacillithiol system redox-active protein YtxJ [Halalkalibacterium halodurans]MED4082235.1 bacillithiol system redox-active protein YtxJ [Halalkalibacterium halodurans]MED4084542.1 bacillithiol system redox-active protein YtxJ
MSVKELTTVEQWQEVFEGTTETPVLVFKHSTQCPVSAEAHQELHALLENGLQWDGQVVLVKVIESRPVSNQIAEDLGVKHESPQAIVVKDQEAIWNKSHWDIKQDTLKAALV